MKYEEYQVWFHAFNNAVLGRSQCGCKDTKHVIDFAECVADHCVEKFKYVEVREKMDLSSLGSAGGVDLKSIVEQVAKDATKGAAKNGNKRR